VSVPYSFARINGVETFHRRPIFINGVGKVPADAISYAVVRDKPNAAAASTKLTTAGQDRIWSSVYRSIPKV
jgi:hypothetical protein